MKIGIILSSCCLAIASICFIPACSSRTAAKEAEAANSEVQVAKELAQKAKAEASLAKSQAEAAEQALQSNTSDPNLQQAAISARARASATQAALDASIIKLDAANQASTRATDKYNSAVEHDNSTWAMIAAIATPVGAAVGIPLGGLVDPFKKLAMGQQQGAAMATTAITNADTQNALQQPTTRDNISNALAATPNIRAAVDAHL